MRYAAEVWAGDLKARQTIKLTSAQRILAANTVAAYATVSA